jgi:hypothetical protein
MGLPRGARSGDGGGKKGPRRSGLIRLLFGRGWVRQGAVGVGEPGRRMEEVGHEQGGVPANRRAAPSRQRPEADGRG